MFFRSFTMRETFHLLAKQPIELVKKRTQLCKICTVTYVFHIPTYQYYCLPMQRINKILSAYGNLIYGTLSVSTRTNRLMQMQYRFFASSEVSFVCFPL